ncbi:MAG: hypothetical protein QW058_03070 [Candidatus Aenigmatarchaeota archaeon]
MAINLTNFEVISKSMPKIKKKRGKGREKTRVFILEVKEGLGS